MTAELGTLSTVNVDGVKVDDPILDCYSRYDEEARLAGRGQVERLDQLAPRVRQLGTAKPAAGGRLAQVRDRFIRLVSRC